MSKEKLTQEEEKVINQEQTDIEKKEPKTLEEQLEIDKKRLQMLELQIEDNRKKRDALKKKINEKELLIKEEKYDSLDEQLRFKGVSMDDVRTAIVNNDMDFLMKLANKKGTGQETEEANKAVQAKEKRAPKPREEKPKQPQEAIGALGPKGQKILHNTEQIQEPPATQQPYGINTFFSENEQGKGLASQQGEHKPQGMSVYFPEPIN